MKNFNHLGQFGVQIITFPLKLKKFNYDKKIRLFTANKNLLADQNEEGSTSCLTTFYFKLTKVILEFILKLKC